MLIYLIGVFVATIIAFYLCYLDYKSGIDIMIKDMFEYFIFTLCSWVAVIFALTSVTIAYTHSFMRKMNLNSKTIIIKGKPIINPKD